MAVQQVGRAWVLQPGPDDHGWKGCPCVGLSVGVVLSIYGRCAGALNHKYTLDQSSARRPVFRHRCATTKPTQSQRQLGPRMTGCVICGMCDTSVTYTATGTSISGSRKLEGG